MLLEDWNLIWIIYKNPLHFEIVALVSIGVVCSSMPDLSVSWPEQRSTLKSQLFRISFNWGMQVRESILNLVVWLWGNFALLSPLYSQLYSLIGSRNLLFAAFHCLPPFAWLHLCSLPITWSINWVGDLVFMVERDVCQTVWVDPRASLSDEVMAFFAVKHF